MFRFAATQARYVRIQILPGGRSQPCIDELAVFSPGSQENLALQSHGAKATASSCLQGHSKHRIEHLNDEHYGNERSWIPKTKTGWAQLKLPKAMRINRVVLSRDRGRKLRGRTPVSFDIPVSMKMQ